MINVVEVPDPNALDDAWEAGLILPVPGSTKNTILLEERDGEAVQRLTAAEVDFKVGTRSVSRVRKVKIDLFITDARFALACSKYDKGGGWVGGAGAMVVFNTVSKARAALRGRGRMLVGQVRYPWIQRVGSLPKTGWTSEEKLIFDTAAQGDATRLILTLPKNLDAARVAAEIANRAARYRLASEDLDPESRAALEQLSSAEPLAASATDTKTIRFFEFPAAELVSEDSARLAPPGDGNSA